MRRDEAVQHRQPRERRDAERQKAQLIEDLTARVEELEAEVNSLGMRGEMESDEYRDLKEDEDHLRDHLGDLESHSF